MESTTDKQRVHKKLEWLTSQWWFYVALSVIPALLPPFAASGLEYWADLGNFISQVSEAMYAKKLEYAGVMPLLHLLVLLSILLLTLLKSRFGRIFTFLVCINILVMIFMQTYVITNKFGLVIISELITWYIVVLLFWFWEAVVGKTKYTFNNLRLNNLWLIPMAIFAFWDPEVSWSFDITYLWNSYAPTAFCMMAPIYLSVMVYQYPNINLPLFRIMSFTGLVLSVVTLGIGFFNDFSYAVYWTILHIPLIVISIYCFKLSFNPRVLETEKAGVGSAVRTVIK